MEARRVTQNIKGLRPDHLVPQHRCLGVGVIDDGLDIRLLATPGSWLSALPLQPCDVSTLHHHLGNRIGHAGVVAFQNRIRPTIRLVIRCV